MIGRGLNRAYLSKGQKIALGLFLFISVFHSFIANDKYIIAKTDQGIQFFQDSESVDYGIRSIIPYSANYMDKDNRSASPFSKQSYSSIYYRHWLGTDGLGRDVLAGLAYGSYIALQVGIFSILLSILLGILFAYLSGYYGDSGLRVDKSKLLALIPIAFILIFYATYSGLVYSIILIFLLISIWILAIKRSSIDRNKTLGIPLDLIVFRLIEVIQSIPGLFLILILLSLFSKPSIWNVIWVIVLLRWPIITRHLRAEILKIKEEDFIMSAKSIGLKDWKIFLHHILPMTISPIIIVSAFGFATAILLESTLSFLGIGVALDQQTWGSIIKQARFDINAWWLALFPGLAIYLLVVLFNSIGDSLNRRMRGL